jgi:hypothetical protein
MKQYKNILIGTGTLLIISLFIGISYAYWIINHTQVSTNIAASGCFLTTFTDQNNINLTNQFPITDSDGNKLTPYTFTIKNTCTINAKYQINLETLNTTTLGLNHVKLSFNASGNTGTPRFLNNIDTTNNTIANATDARNLGIGYLDAGQSKTYELRLWIDQDTTTEEGSNKTYASKIVVQTSAATYAYTDPSGANSPELYQGLIPVTYDESGNTVVADTSTEWYSYNDRNWANAVLVNCANSTIKSKYFDELMNVKTSMIGQVIPQSEILQMYVWIPRYKYLLWNANNGSSNEKSISLTFEKNTDTKSTGSTNDTWLTHPAFTFGDSELNGFWVGKFEASGTTDNLTIKPNQQSLTNLTVGQMFTSTRNEQLTYSSNYGISPTSIDTHMIKNMEWGAVAYLSSSIYGRYINSSTCIVSGCETWINNVNTLASGSYGPSITGCSGSSVSAGMVNSMSACANGYSWSGLGVNASANGNITGIYDMSGGTWEYVMGNMVDGTGNFYPSSSGLTKLDVKYFDSYAYSASSYIDHARGKLGDATKETLKTFGSETGGWYGDTDYLPSATYSWFSRGGGYSWGATAGVFNFGRNTGVAGADASFRSVLSAQ